LEDQGFLQVPPNWVMSNFLERQNAWRPRRAIDSNTIGSRNVWAIWLPRRPLGSRGPPPKWSLFEIFNDNLRPLLIGCHRKELAIERDDEGRPEIHYHALQPLVYRLAEADLPAPAAERLTLDEKHDKAGKPYGIPIFTARPTWLARGASWTGMLA
jgi:hypothetical protein